MSEELGVAKGIIQKVQTTVDGGLRVSLDFGGCDLDLVKKLLEISMGETKQVVVAFVRPKPSAVNFSEPII